MKKAKRILVMLMAIVMVMGMAMTVSAAGPAKGTNEDKGTIVVNGIEKADLDVKAYPLALAKYENGGSFSGYDTTHITDPQNVTKEQLEAITDPAALGTAIPLTYDPAANTYKSDGNQAVGMYLIVVPGHDATTYEKAVASIYYANNETGDMIVNDADLTMAATVESGAAWVKKNVKVTVDKKVNNVAGTTADVGDTLNYEVVISPVPNYTGENPKLEATDKLSAGLHYEGDVKVYSRDTATNTDTEISGDKYVASFDDADNTLKVDFVKTGADGKKVYGLTEYAGGTIVIKYSVTLTADARMNEADNPNEVTVKYTKDSSTTGSDGTDTDKTHTYTFEIDGQTEGSLTEQILTKYGEETVEGSTEKKPLPGAVFTLYKADPAGKTEEQLAELVYTNDTFTADTMTTDGKGKIKISGLEEGTYWLKETEAPGDYSLNSHVFKIVIDATLNEDGELTGWTITIDDDSTSSFTVDQGAVTEKTIAPVGIPNTKMNNLPSTGGIGTYVFTVAGILIMALAAGFFFVSRRKAAK